MSRWQWRAAWLGLVLGVVGCGESPPPSEGCEATASCDGNRGGGPNIDLPGNPSPDAGTTPPPGNGDGGTTPPPGNGDGGTTPPPGNGDAGTTPPPAQGATGETLWLRHEALSQSEFAASVAATPDGQAVYTASMRGASGSGMFIEGENSAFILRRYSVSGQLQWTRELVLRAHSYNSPNDVYGRIQLSVGPTGELYLLTDVRAGYVTMTEGGQFPGVALFKMNPGGTLVWSNAFPNPLDQGLALVASRQGGVFVSARASYDYDAARQCTPSAGIIYRYDANGAVLWRKSLGEAQCNGYRADAVALAAQPDGGVAMGGSFFGLLQTPMGYATANVESPFFGALTAQGEWSWLKTFPKSHGRVTSLGSSAKGTVVGAGVLQGGGFTWGTTALDTAPSFLFVAEANGEPRWAQSLGRTEQPVIAVEPAGRVAVAGLSRDAAGEQNPQLFARRFNLAGKLLWNRYFKRSGGPDNLFSEQVVSAAPSGEGSGNTLLLGHFSHTEDFGTGPRTPRGTNVFLLKLGAGPEF